MDPHDDDAIFGAMRALVDPDTARGLGSTARARAETFTWAATGERVLRALDLGGVPAAEPAG